MTELQAEFGDIVDGAYDHVFDKKVPVGRFVNRLTNLPIERMEVHKEFLEKITQEFDKGTTVDKLWLQLTKYWNFLNYFLLEQVVCKFGDADLKTSMEDYTSKLKAFRCKTRLCDFAKCSTKISRNLSEEDFNLLAAKLNQDWEECNLKDLEKFTHKFFLPSFTLTLREIKPGCIHVTWAIPAVIGASLKENMESTDIREFCKEHGITSITIDGEECKNLAAVKEYSTYLQYAYSKKKGENLAPYKLARMSKRKPINRGMWDDYTRSTFRGDQDDVVYTKEHMDECELGTPTYQPESEHKEPRFVLIIKVKF